MKEISNSNKIEFNIPIAKIKTNTAADSNHILINVVIDMLFKTCFRNLLE